jgi:hypothetical protein
MVQITNISKTVIKVNERKYSNFLEVIENKGDLLFTSRNMRDNI